MTLIEKIREKIEDRIKAANQYAYLKRQYDLATHMEKDHDNK